MRVLCLTRYGRLGASSRLRFYQYLPHLAAEGIEVTVAPLLPDDYLRDLYGGRPIRWGAILTAYLGRVRSLVAARAFDLVWLEKELLPWLPAWGERWLSAWGIPYVVDYDDAIFHNYDRHASPLVRALLARKIDAVMRRAALVVAGNDYLAERAQRAGARRVACLPTVIDLERYPVATSASNDVFTIGWIGSPSTAGYLRLIGSALADVCAGGRARLMLVGSGPLELEGVPAEIRPWSEASEVAELHRFDAGIMPLPDEPWERGKCAYKLIQYMACALPVAASPVGMNCQVVGEGVEGFLCANQEDWTRALIRLRDEPALRQTLGRAARRKVEERYCLQVAAPILEGLLRSALAA